MAGLRMSHSLVSRNINNLNKSWRYDFYDLPEQTLEGASADAFTEPLGRSSTDDQSHRAKRRGPRNRERLRSSSQRTQLENLEENPRTRH